MFHLITSFQSLKVQMHIGHLTIVSVYLSQETRTINHHIAFSSYSLSQ
jgi:hypothetical protein